MVGRAHRNLALLLLVLALQGGAAWADEKTSAEDPATEAYLRALRMQRKGKWKSAKRAFEKFIDKYPDSEHVEDALSRSGDNAFLGCTEIWTGGPSKRRIDVAVMGDGFTTDVSDQKLQKNWADLCIKVLFNEKSFDEYRNYFNIYFVRLASLEEGVDPKLSDEQRAKIEERNKRRHRKKKTEYSTALDCKEAGPQRQVRANRSLVYKWLDVAAREIPGCADDRFVIAFARFGKLGMGGSGVANVGRPDKSITVHEFGHAFSRLLDEYQGNPNPPRGGARRWNKAANASYTGDPEKVPWAHMLKAKIKNVGVYEGGATFNKGVWRPAKTCAMNSGGANQFCPVCREASVLVIYEYVNPIDTSSPPVNLEVMARSGDDTLLTVTPMQPVKHRLKVTWYVEPIEADDPGPVQQSDESHSFVDDFGTPRRRWASFFGGARGRKPRDEYAEPPAGDPSKLGKIRKGKPVRHVFAAGKLPPGRYRVTAEVRDPTKWVIQDPKHLLVERETWWVRVAPKPTK